VATGKEVSRLEGHQSGGVRRVEFTSDGKTLVSGGFDGFIRIWDLATRKQLREIRADSGTVYGIAISSDGKTIASAGRDGLKLWELESGNQLPRANMAKHGCIAVGYSPDGKLVASGDSSTVVIWEVASGKEIHTLKGFQGEISQLIFSADCRTLYTSSYDRAIRLWEVRTGRQIHEAEGHSGWVWGIALSKDEKTLASCSVDTRLLRWNLAGLGRPDGKKARLSNEQLNTHLKDLASSDAGAAYRAVCALAGDPENSLPQLQKRLTAVRRNSISQADLMRMLQDLDDEEWPVREKASADLEKAGAVALEHLKKTLAKPPSLEVKRRVERLLRRLDPTLLPPEELVTLRGVQTLEYIGTAEARKVLEQLASSSSGARVAEEASQAVERMTRTVNR
jgi:hypothetical protein